MEHAEIINEALRIDEGTAGQVMSEALMDDTICTRYMFEGMAASYLKGTEEYRRGIDKACLILMHMTVAEIAKKIIETEEEEVAA